jgi:hypothetical protein
MRPQTAASTSRENFQVSTHSLCSTHSKARWPHPHLTCWHARLASACSSRELLKHIKAVSCVRLSADNFSFPSMACFMECLRRAREMPSGDQRFQSREQDRHSRARPVTRRCAAFATHASKLQHCGTDQPADHPVIEIVMHASTWGTLL